MKLDFSPQFFEKYSSIKFHVNLCGQMDGSTDMTKLIVVFRNFANAPKVQLLAHTNHILPHVSAVDRHCRGEPPHSAEPDSNFPQFIQF